MLTEKKLWKYQILVERMWRLSLDIAAQGARLKNQGNGIMFVAEETRHLTDKLYQHYEEMLDNEGVINNVEALEKTIQNLRVFSVNATIEMLKTFVQLDINTEQLPLLFESLSNISDELIELVSSKRTTECVQLEVKDRSTTNDQEIFLMMLKIGPEQFVENIKYVQEVFTYNKETEHLLFDDDNSVIIRGEKIPVINAYESLGLSKYVASDNDTGFMIIVNTKWKNDDRKYAVLVDDIVKWSIFKTPLGREVACRNDSLAASTRACWDAEERKQFLFMDWSSM